MPVASSDGVGRTLGTWGIHDDRSTWTGSAKVSYNGQDIDTCRKFMLGDIITCVADVAEVRLWKTMLLLSFIVLIISVGIIFAFVHFFYLFVGLV